MSGPFDGVRVVDVTHVLAGPYCTYLLALLGADVVKVEAPAGLDFVRFRGGSDPAMNALGLASGFLVQNANKRSLGLDLKHRRGAEIFGSLVARADVVVENFRPGVMERLGLGQEALARRNRRLVHCSLTGYGQSGAWHGRPAYDHVVQAVSGMMAANATDDGRPRRVGFPIIDYVTGLMAGFAIASALFERTHSDRGQHIDVAMMDSAVAMMAPLVAQTVIGGGLRARTGDRAASGSPFSGMFETADGWLALAANTVAQGRRVAALLGMDEIAADHRMEAFVAHPEFADEVEAALAARLRGRSALAWESLLSEHDVPAGKVRDVAEALAAAPLVERGFLQWIGGVPGRPAGIEVPGPGFRLARGSAGVTAPPPRLGEHSLAVLAEIGIDAAEASTLLADGVIATADPDPDDSSEL